MFNNAYSSPGDRMREDAHGPHRDRDLITNAPPHPPDWFVKKCHEKGITDDEEIFFLWPAYYAKQAASTERRVQQHGTVPIAPGHNAALPAHYPKFKFADHPLTLEEKAAAKKKLEAGRRREEARRLLSEAEQIEKGEVIDDDPIGGLLDG